MGSAKTCDLCGALGAETIQVMASIESVVLPGQPTAHIDGCDACAGCQVEALEKTFAHAVEQLREQVPIHREMIAAARERDAAQGAFNQIAPTLKALAEHGKDLPASLAKERDRLLGQIAAAEERHAKAYADGTKKSDARVAAFRANLKKH